MITTEMILSLGWKLEATAADGGTNIFGTKVLWQSYGKEAIYNLVSSADNFILPEEERKVIRIQKIPIDFSKIENVYEGKPTDLDDLKRILVETGADLKWKNEIRDKKIDDICRTDSHPKNEA